MFQLNNGLLAVDGAVIQFKRSISAALEYNNDIIILITELDSDLDTANNIYAIQRTQSRDWKLLWQVQDVGQYRAAFMSDQYQHQGDFVSIQISDDTTKLLATTFHGYRFLIDITTGSIVGLYDWTK